MSQPLLSVVIPTIGRPSLLQTLDSLDGQVEDDWLEVLVVADTHGGPTRILEQARDHVREERDANRYVWLDYDGGLHCWGHPQRTAGARTARAPWVWFSQDDNIAAPQGLDAIARGIAAQPHPRPMFFRWLSPWRETIWRDHHLALGNIDADCLVLPRHIAQRVIWGLRYEGDFDAALAAVQFAAGDVDWRDEVVSIARPGDADLWWKAA